MTFVEGEHRLSAWMADNADVTWVETPAPWAAEQELIAAVDLPLTKNVLAATRRPPCRAMPLSGHTVARHTNCLDQVSLPIQSQ
jgi:hypothetical protein